METDCEDELGRWINKQNDCPDDPPPYLWRLDYYEFKGDGNQEAIFVAASCMTGTAGPESILFSDAMLSVDQSTSKFLMSIRQPPTICSGTAKPDRYDCGKAEKEVENAICHVEELAKLDVGLGTVHKSVLPKPSEAESNFAPGTTTPMARRA